MGYRDPELVGIGGWLKFFLISMTVLSPITIAFRLAATLYGSPQIALFYADRNWVAVQVAEWSLVAISIALCWFIAYRLIYVRVRSTVKITIIGLWVISVGIAIAEPALISLIGGISFMDILSNSMPQYVRPLIYTCLWTGYFLRSRRVANTYVDSTETLATVFS